jgi:F0F1-type ATP synthase membrane subunit a
MMFFPHIKATVLFVNLAICLRFPMPSSLGLRVMGNMPAVDDAA